MEICCFIIQNKLYSRKNISWRITFFPCGINILHFDWSRLCSIKSVYYHQMGYMVRFRKSLEWPHNERDGVSNPRRPECLLNGLLRRRSKKKSKLRVPVIGGFPSQRARDAENVSIWWRHHEKQKLYQIQVRLSLFIRSCLEARVPFNIYIANKLAAVQFFWMHISSQWGAA